MKKLQETKKITLASLKSFAKRNEDKLFFKEKSGFSSMSDMVEQNSNPEWHKSKVSLDKVYYRTGIDGIYTVGSSRDYFEIYQDDDYYGIEVYNSCGSSILAIRK